MPKMPHWRLQLLIADALLAGAAGCGKEPAVATAKRYVSTWPKQGAQLPDREQINFYRANFGEALPTLRQAIADPDPKVRMRAAYVIGEIGEPARSAGPALLAGLLEEPDDRLRIYIVNALSAIKNGDPVLLAKLRELYSRLDSENVPEGGDHSYAEVDEKISVASALYVLSNQAAERKECLDFVVQWLQPPPEGLSEELLEGYWQRRGMAVNSLTRMRGATDAVPLLEAMLNEPDAKPWVKSHVSRAINEIGNKQPGVSPHLPQP